jgi:hypothetical protein
MLIIYKPKILSNYFSKGYMPKICICGENLLTGSYNIKERKIYIIICENHLQNMERSTKYRTCEICGIRDVPFIKKKINLGIIYNSEDVEYVFDHSHDPSFYEDKLKSLYDEMNKLAHEHKTISVSNGYEYFTRKDQIKLKFEELNKMSEYYKQIISTLKKNKPENP